MNAFFDLPQFKSLANELRPGTDSCPFVVDRSTAKYVSLSHFEGGREAIYVLVSRKLDSEESSRHLAVTIGYRPFVAGTTIIYDATSETMQGKARPFVCHMYPSQRARVYAVMPFQIETISVRAVKRQLNVEFLDARGERIAAALPFELRLFNAAGKVMSAEYQSTDRGGRFSCDPATASRATVRSLLTAREESFTLEPRSALRG